MVKDFCVKDCLYVQVDVEVILHEEPAEHVEEPDVIVADLKKLEWKDTVQQ